MQIYKKAYLKLFNAITDALTALDSPDIDSAKAILMSAQQTAEELFISQPGPSEN